MNDILKKQVRFTLTFSLSVTDSPLTVNEPVDQQGTQAHKERITPQLHLFEALLADTDILEEYMSIRIAEAIEDLSRAQWEELVLGESVNEKEVLDPLVAKLPQDERVYFEEAHREGRWAESTARLRESFEATIERVHMVEEPAS